MGPGAYISRDEHQDMDREREWERSRELNRGREYPSSHVPSPLLHRSRSALERGEHPEHHPRAREDPGYYHEGPPSSYPIHRHPDSPGPGSGLGQRPDTLAHSYGSERSRSYRLRPVNQPHDDDEYMHAEDGRSQIPSGGAGSSAPLPQEPSRTPAELSRKRSHNEMDVDSDPETEITSGAGNPGYIGGRLSDDRSTKRYHLPRNVGNHEDSRIGQP